MKKVLAFDLGASSGRAIVGIFDQGKIQLHEVHRFSNDPVRVHGHFYWDILRLFHEMKIGMIKCVNSGHADISSIGIDTWGVDYGFIDGDGELIGNPYHYRDSRTVGVVEKVEHRLTKELIYSETGIQTMAFNTIYQLASTPVPQNADKLLFIPDLLAYFLTGEKRCERTILSTSQLLNPNTGEISDKILGGLGISKSLFCDIIEPCEVYGRVSKEISDELHLPQIPVIAVATHDTASAVVSVPFSGENGAYISCGTWSLLGMELDTPLINERTQMYNYTNEAGCNGSIRFLKNIMGLWLSQQCRQQWEHDGDDVSSYSILNMEAKAAADFPSRIDPDDASFLAPFDMPKAIRDYCEKTGQMVPQTKGEYLITIVKSLAEKYRVSIEALEELTGQSIDTIHMVGGGINDVLLCQATADVTGRAVTAGPAEATAAGNIIVQLIFLGEIANVKEGREIAKKSLEIKEWLRR